MASGGGASARILTIAGAQLQPDQAAADLGELDADAASQLATYIGANAALVKLTFAAPRGRVMLVADVVKMDLSSKGIDMHGARIIASFLPRWYVGARACRRARGADPRGAMPRSRETNGFPCSTPPFLCLTTSRTWQHCEVSAPLTDLNLQSNSIGVEGAKAIAVALPR